MDALNLSSLREQLPFGLYDLDQVRPPVELRLGGAGEAYEGIRKGPVQVEGRPVLVDAEGPFGNPTSDSLRTCITLATTRCLVVALRPGRLRHARASTASSTARRPRSRRPAAARSASKRQLPLIAGPRRAAAAYKMPS